MSFSRTERRRRARGRGDARAVWCAMSANARARVRPARACGGTCVDLSSACRRGCRDCTERLHDESYGVPPWDAHESREMYWELCHEGFIEPGRYQGHGLSGLRAAMERLLELTPDAGLPFWKKPTQTCQTKEESEGREKQRAFILWMLDRMVRREHAWSDFSIQDFESQDAGIHCVCTIRSLMYKIGDVDILRAAVNVPDFDFETRVPIKDQNAYIFTQKKFDHLLYFRCRVDVYRFFHAETPTFVPELKDRKNCDILGKLNDMYRHSPPQWKELVAYLVEQGYDWPSDTLVKLARITYRFDDVEKKAIEDYEAAGCPLHPHIVREAAKRGNLDALRWLRMKKAPFDKFAVSWAANSGQIETLKYLLDEIKVKLDPMMCARAAEGGELKALQTLHEAGVPWDKRVIVAAAKEKKSKKKRTREGWRAWAKLDRIKCLQFALAHGCPGADAALELNDDQISENTRTYLEQVTRRPALNHWFFRVSRILGATSQAKMPATSHAVLTVITNRLRLRQESFENDAFVGVA